MEGPLLPKGLREFCLRKRAGLWLWQRRSLTRRPSKLKHAAAAVSRTSLPIQSMGSAPPNFGEWVES
jgi:hypothetical protein